MRINDSALLADLHAVHSWILSPGVPNLVGDYPGSGNEKRLLGGVYDYLSPVAVFPVCQCKGYIGGFSFDFPSVVQRVVQLYGIARLRSYFQALVIRSCGVA